MPENSGEGTTIDESLKSFVLSKVIEAINCNDKKAPEPDQVPILVDSSSSQNDLSTNSYFRQREVKQKVLDIIGRPKPRSTHSSITKDKKKREKKSYEKKSLDKPKREKNKRAPPKMARKFDHSRKRQRVDYSEIIEIVDSS